MLTHIFSFAAGVYLGLQLKNTAYDVTQPLVNLTDDSVKIVGVTIIKFK